MSVVRINAITVSPERAAELEQRFADRAGEVAGMPGFEGFELLRPTDDRGIYLVYTRWESVEAFEAWVQGEAFQRGHAAHRGSGPVGTASELWSFEVVERETAPDGPLPPSELREALGGGEEHPPLADLPTSERAD